MPDQIPWMSMTPEEKNELIAGLVRDRDRVVAYLTVDANGRIYDEDVGKAAREFLASQQVGEVWPKWTATDTWLYRYDDATHCWGQQIGFYKDRWVPSSHGRDPAERDISHAQAVALMPEITKDCPLPASPAGAEGEGEQCPQCLGTGATKSNDDRDGERCTRCHPLSRPPASPPGERDEEVKKQATDFYLNARGDMGFVGGDAAYAIYCMTTFASHCTAELRKRAEKLNGEIDTLHSLRAKENFALSAAESSVQQLEKVVEAQSRVIEAWEFVRHNILDTSRYDHLAKAKAALLKLTTPGASV